jgi:hypothetical protein
VYTPRKYWAENWKTTRFGDESLQEKKNKNNLKGKMFGDCNGSKYFTIENSGDVSEYGKKNFISTKDSTFFFTTGPVINL